MRFSLAKYALSTTPRNNRSAIAEAAAQVIASEAELSQPLTIDAVSEGAGNLSTENRRTSSFLDGGRPIPPLRIRKPIGYRAVTVRLIGESAITTDGDLEIGLDATGLVFALVSTRLHAANGEDVRHFVVAEERAR
jgi:hypothetical protein